MATSRSSPALVRDPVPAVRNTWQIFEENERADRLAPLRPVVAARRSQNLARQVTRLADPAPPGCPASGLLSANPFSVASDVVS
jgi:hypothetical protein